MSSSRCQMLPPATKNIVNAVSVMTPVVPRSGSSATSTMTRPTMSRNGNVAVAQARRCWARAWPASARGRRPVASLAISAGWIAGSGPSWSQRAESPTLMGWNGPMGGSSTMTSRTSAPRKAGTEIEAQVAIVEADHREQRDHAQQRPRELRRDRRERTGAAAQRGTHAGAGVDHQDARSRRVRRSR